MEAYCRKFEKYRKFEEAKEKNILTLLPRNNHFLGNLLLYIHFFFFSLPVLPPRICFKNSEDVQDRAWSRECYGILEDPVFHRGTQKEEGKVEWVHGNRLLVSWPINGFAWATVSLKYFYMFLSDRMLSLVIPFMKNSKIETQSFH